MIDGSELGVWWLGAGIRKVVANAVLQAGVPGRRALGPVLSLGSATSGIPAMVGGSPAEGLSPRVGVFGVQTLPAGESGAESDPGFDLATASCAAFGSRHWLAQGVRQPQGLRRPRLKRFHLASEREEKQGVS